MRDRIFYVYVIHTNQISQGEQVVGFYLYNFVTGVLVKGFWTLPKKSQLEIPTNKLYTKKEVHNRDK